MNSTGAASSTARIVVGCAVGGAVGMVAGYEVGMFSFEYTVVYLLLSIGSLVALSAHSSRT